MKKIRTNISDSVFQICMIIFFSLLFFYMFLSLLVYFYCVYKRFCGFAKNSSLFFARAGNTRELQTNFSAAGYLVGFRSFRAQNGYWYGHYFMFYQYICLYSHKKEIAWEKTFLSFCSDFHVLECRADPLVFNYEKYWYEGHLFSICHSWSSSRL